ncbi:glycosyltransferase [Streptomyces sp. NPDC047014]|uniref:glycosyltransferase n=1 Tax=Streptomyces sp. NPDC047014 TaxID=3155736 RepID=UPI0033D3C859
MIGYYVHHQGLGHLHRAQCIAAHVQDTLTILSSLPRPEAWTREWVPLPPDSDDAPVDPTARGRLHWAPVHHQGHQERMGTIAEWIRRTRPTLFVSDVSVEAAALARLMGTPVAIAAMRGDRSDEAHRLAYDLADALIAPWPESFPERDWPAHWHAKTLHTGSISRYDGRPHLASGSDDPPSRKEVVVMLGAGGTDVTDRELEEAIRATPDWSWTFLGGPRAHWTDDPWPLLCRADVVVTHAGQNAIAECAAARVPTIVIPQDRPHGEQRATARALHAAGLATVRDSWPAPHAWARLLVEAAALQNRWERWSPGDGAQRAGRLLTELARRTPRQPVCVAQ